VLRLSSIGDVCNAIPAVQAIQRECPDARLTWIVGRREAELVAGLPGVESIVYDKQRGPAGYAAVRRQLRGRRFDALLHMQVSIRASLVSLLVRSPRRIGFDRARAVEGQWLFSNAAIQAQQHAHVVDGFTAFAAAVGVPDYSPSWDIPVDQADRETARALLPEGGRVFAIVPAASETARNWTPEGYAALADHAGARGFSVALFGGPAAAERQLADAVRSRAKVQITDCVGRTTLGQLLALLAETRLLLAPDTGPVHLAVSQGVPVIGLYCHSNPRRTGPYGGLDYVVNHYDRSVQQQTGRSWRELPWGTRARGADLMSAIRVSEVVEKFDRIVADRGLSE
jgi:heptosyltransferase I